MPRFKLTIEYAGTRYSGWQIQKNARTVQGELVRALRDAAGTPDVEVYGSGRTDAGVGMRDQTPWISKAFPIRRNSPRRVEIAKDKT